MAEAQRPDRREHGVLDERTTLESFLDDYRDIVVRKVSGLSEADARRRLVPSATTVAGLVKHLRWAEYGWFDQFCRDEATTTVARTSAPGSSSSTRENRCQH